MRRILYQKGWLTVYKPTIPTICVGNIAVGGTGKTPHIEYLIRLLSPQYSIATLSRGYKRTTKGFLSSNASNCEINAETLGDEPMQFHTHFPDIPIAVCENRAVGIQNLIKEENHLQVILLDDAFQHLSVRCGLNIILTEYSRPYFSDFPMPAGNLREFGTAASFADMIIVTKTPQDLTLTEKQQFTDKMKVSKTKPIFFTTYAYNNPEPLTEKAKLFSLQQNTKILLLTGIAHPEPLQNEIAKYYPNIESLTFSDHHIFTDKEISFLQQKYQQSGENDTVFFTTEKDSFRLISNRTKKAVSLLPFFTIPIKVEFLFEEELLFNKNIQDYVEKN